MYSTVGLLSSSPVAGKLTGTHQKLDRAARKLLGKHLPKGATFPTAKEIVYFEGTRGPDGLKRKSPGVDEPMHFIIPHDDDGQLIEYISNHHYNLVHALRSKNQTRAAFEAAWLAHAITDGLTPAHHVPLVEYKDQLMTNKEFVKIFGAPIKGIMHGKNFLQTARHNWLYWGAGGGMSRHIAFEYGLAVMATSLPLKKLMPKDFKHEDLANIDYRREFYRSLDQVVKLDMYERFKREGWTAGLALDAQEVLFPVVVRTVTLAWASAVDQARHPSKIQEDPPSPKNAKPQQKSVAKQAQNHARQAQKQAQNHAKQAQSDTKETQNHAKQTQDNAKEATK